MISIIIRTKNEERWIAQCLGSVFNQDCADFEVILVDNESTDKTIDKAMQFPIKKIVACKDYLPGKALNMGIREAMGDLIVCLSGHCIPVNDRWLSSLLGNFTEPSIAGVYGRQEAMAFTSSSDKRDLALLFGLDRRVQEKDSFFHNANSMLRKEVWYAVPFDETVTNIEDRVWAHKVLQKGHKVVYEPKASVYHYHGIHQNGDAERCTNVVRILESLNADYNYKPIEVEKLNVVAIIPVRGCVQYLKEKPLLAYTIERARESSYIKKVIVSTDNSEIARLAERLGAEVPFMRAPYLSKEYVDIVHVLEYSLQKIEENKIFPDLLVSLEVTFPFRPKGFLDNMITQLAKFDFDSVVAVKRENRALWKEKDGAIVQLDEGITPRQFKDPTLMELRGLGCVTRPEFLREGNLLGEKVGFYEIDNPYSHLEVRSSEDLEMASALIDRWFR